MVRSVLLAVTLLLSLPLMAVTELNAIVDKNPALQGEAITLEVSADGRLAADAINFKVLEQDFTVMMPAVTTSTQIINGQASQSTHWKVVLLAKKTGKLTIPAFTLQGLSTMPIELQILAGTATTNNSAAEELFLEASIEQQQLYVQQLSYYQVKIFFNGDLQRGSLSEPQMENATITQVGQDLEGTELVNGIRYRTITRRYAITPQRSGNFTISAPTFSGEMIDRDSARYNYFARTKTVVQQAQTIDVSVNAIPDNFPGNWLVAGLVTLTEEWSPEVTELKQGEPVTRTITLSAVDVAENQLPQLNLSFPQGLRLYQEQPQTKSAERSGRLVAQKVFTTAVIANKAGSIELPEVTLPWWNSKTDQLEFARLPARTLNVVPSQSNTDNLPLTTSRPNELAVPEPDSQQAITSPWQWNYLSTSLLGLWLVSLFVFYLLWQLRPPKTVSASSETRVRFNHAALKVACQQGDAREAKAQMLRFGHQQLDLPCRSLTELSQQINCANLQQQLGLLNAALYGAGNTRNWQGEPLWQAWLQYQKKKEDKTDINSLSPLYPG